MNVALDDADRAMAEDFRERREVDPSSTMRVAKVWRLCRARHKRQHADFLIMPTTNWKQQFGGAQALSRVGIIKGFPGRLTAYRQVGIVLV
jgi:hypothetical protein